MINIQQTYRKLGDLLKKEKASFELSQKMQFDWLQSIEAQLDLFDTPSKPLAHRLSFEDPPQNKHQIENSHLMPKGNDENNPNSINQNESNLQSTDKSELLEENDNESESTSTLSNLPMNNNQSATTPCFSNSSMRFVDDQSLLLESSDDEDESEIDNGPPIPFTLSNSVSELTQSASSFREKWLEMLHQKKASTSIPKKPFKFAFEDEEVSMPDAYQISDSEDETPEDDEEIYDANPIEIHGKAIPSWARGDLLLKQLKKQQRIDPDSIFSEFTADSLDLPAVFNEHKAKWENRSDSGCWEHDRVTDEEIANFKTSLNIQ